MIVNRICLIYTILGAILYVLGYICGSSKDEEDNEHEEDENTL